MKLSDAELADALRRNDLDIVLASDEPSRQEFVAQRGPLLVEQERRARMRKAINAATPALLADTHPYQELRDRTISPERQETNELEATRLLIDQRLREIEHRLSYGYSSSEKLGRQAGEDLRWAVETIRNLLESESR